MEKLREFEVRDLRKKEKFFVDDAFLNGYAKVVKIYATGVYLSLCRHADQNQKAFPSIKKIAEELNISRRSVLRALNILEEHKIIKRERIGKQLTNRYYLLDRKYWVKSVTAKSSEAPHSHLTSEVPHSHFTGAPQSLHGCPTVTSIERIHNSKDTQEEGIYIANEYTHTSQEEENQQASKGAQVITSSSYSICGEIVDYLNKQIGTRYKPTTPKTQRLIRARLREGFTLEDFKRVIDKKCAAWRADAEMCRYLRPETLFGTKFESYLNEPEKEDWQE